MDEIIKELSCLTEKQREAYLLREEGLTYQAIGDKMGISTNAARTHVLHAECRFREYTLYHKIEEKNQELADIDLTRGELKVIMEALVCLERDIMKTVKFNVQTDWRGRLPYEAKVVVDTYRKASIAVYGEDHGSARMFVGAFDTEAKEEAKE